MQVKSITNLFLLLFAAGALWLLFKYTNVPSVGIKESFNEGIQNVKRIIQDHPPEDQMSEVEKGKLSKKLGGARDVTPLYCQSAYFPFTPGANWSYQVTGGDVIKIGVPGLYQNGTEQKEEKYFLDGRLVSREGWTNRTITVCQGNKIRLTDFNFLLIFERDRTVTTPCSENQYGFSLPADDYLVRDNAWSEKGCLIHTILNQDYQGKETEIKEDLEVKGRVLGRENITVPAGNFDSVKIELSFSGRQELRQNSAGQAPNQNGAGQEFSVGIKRMDSVVDIWAAPGVGIVKTAYTEKESGKPPVLQELTGFQIPTEKEYKSK